jgi:acyl dehydratase
MTMTPRVIDTLADLHGLVGQELGVSDWVTVSQPMIERFAELTDDPNWIHIDVERARAESPYGVPIAHGFLTLSLLSSLVRRAVSIGGDLRHRINYGFNRVRFPSAVPAGSRIRAIVRLQAIDDRPEGSLVTWGVTVEVEHQPKPALVAEWLVRLSP